MEMTPRRDKIFIEPIDKKVTSLIVPPKYSYRSKEFSSGRVIAKGSKIDCVEVGDEIAYHKDFGVNVELDDRKFTVILKHHILAVV